MDQTPLNSETNDGNDGTQGDVPRITVVRGVARETEDLERSADAKETTVSTLYHLSINENPQLFHSIRLLDEGLALIAAARENFRNSNPFGADDCALKLRMLLPELFFCDSLGEGFKSSVLATFYSLVNLEGMPLSQDQLIAIKEAMEALKKQPYLSFEAALQVHERYEAVELEPDPKGVDFLLEALVAEDEVEVPDRDAAR